MNSLKNGARLLNVNSAIIDSSAFLAGYFKETGGDFVQNTKITRIMSSVNIAEVMCVLTRRNINPTIAEQGISFFTDKIIPFTAAQAVRTGIIQTQTKHLGLSLGDCACLALAEELQLPILTADKAWLTARLGVEVVLIR
jgi:ribonuclease VapC